MQRQPPVELVEFAKLFNNCRFWESHEVLEGPWREHRSEFYHGLILFASAFVHVERGNAHGIAAQLEKAERSLESCRPAYLGVDVDGLLRHARSALRSVAADPDARSADWGELIPAPTLTLDPARVRGDEMELDAAGENR